MLVKHLALVAALSTMLGLSACDRLKKEAEGAAADRLIDPASAQFRNVAQHERAKADKSRDKFVCGEVNGKNRMGAYAGFTRFVYGPLDGTKEKSIILASGDEISSRDIDLARRDCDDQSSNTYYRSTYACDDFKEKLQRRITQIDFEIKWLEVCEGEAPEGGAAPSKSDADGG